MIALTLGLAGLPVAYQALATSCPINDRTVVGSSGATEPSIKTRFYFYTGNRNGTARTYEARIATEPRQFRSAKTAWPIG